MSPPALHLAEALSDLLAVVASPVARFATSTARNTIPAVVATAELTMSSVGVRKRNTAKGSRLAGWGIGADRRSFCEAKFVKTRQAILLYLPKCPIYNNLSSSIVPVSRRLAPRAATTHGVGHRRSIRGGSWCPPHFPDALPRRRRFRCLD